MLVVTVPVAALIIVRLRALGTRRMFSPTKQGWPLAVAVAHGPACMLVCPGRVYTLVDSMGRHRHNNHLMKFVTSRRF